MKLPKLAIENHQFTNVFVILLVLFGMVSFFTMPRSEDPQISPAGTNVVVIYPGANPADLEELVLDPIGEVINELEDIKDIKASAQDGLAVLAVEFLSGADPDDKYSDVVQKVNSIRSDLPAEIFSLELLKWSISDVSILQLALVTDDADYVVLEAEADRLKKMLERVSGVKKVKKWAYPEREVRVSVDMEKLAHYRLPLGQIMGALVNSNQNLPGGSVDVGSRRFNIRTSGNYTSLDQIRATVIHAADGKILRLADVAEVDFAFEDKKYTGRFNGQPAIFITVTQKPGTNIFDVMERLDERVSEFSAALPTSINLARAFDQSESVADRMNGFFLNLLQGLALVGLVVLLAVSLRGAIIVMLAIPVSIMIGIGFVDSSGYGLEQMSIAGLVIALGLLVDNAIVVIENITRFMKMGLSRKEAAIKGTSQIAWAVVSSTATTVLAFVPLMMMQNVSGDFIRSMPVTVVYTLSASLLISLILTPYLSSRWLRKRDALHESKLRHVLNSQVEHQYRSTLNFALNNPTRIVLVAVIVFVASLGLFPLVGVSFFPKAEKPQFIINIDTPEGSSLDKTDSVAAYVERELMRHDEIRHYAANIGHGNPRIYYNVISKNEVATHAQIFIQMNESDLDSFNNLIRELRDKFSRYPGARIEVKEFEQGPPVEAPVAIRILGDELDVLQKISRDVEDMVNSAAGTVNVNNPIGTSKTDLHVRVNRDKAGMLGIRLNEIDRTVRAAMAGLVVSRFRDSNGEEHNIVVRLPNDGKPQIRDLSRIYVSSLTGVQIPLDQVAKLEFRASPQVITQYNLERNVTITADLTGTVTVDDAMAEIAPRLEAYDWPKGYRYAIAGELESRDESFGGMIKAVIVALVGIFGVLVLQFRSYSQPLIVFSAIPMAMIGSIMALLATGNTFSFTAFVGLTSLVGIVVNNSIILVDYTNQLRAEGKNIIEALKEAGETRFMPIVLTTATTVGGLLPLTLGGGSMWAPMGWTIIGGLLMSTFLTLVVVPVLYQLYTKES
jgi:multidrug efflux pump subunit AcrB